MDFPKYRYPGLDSIRAVMEALGNTWTNLRKVSRLTSLKEWKVRSALAFLVFVGIAERVRRGRLFFYRLKEGKDLFKSFMRNEVFFWVMWSLYVGLPVRRGPWVEFALKFATEARWVEGNELTEMGRREVLAAAIERAFLEIAGARKVVPLSEISEVLEGWGLSKEEFRRSALGAISHLRNARIVRLGRGKVGDYLDIHGLVIAPRNSTL